MIDFTVVMPVVVIENSAESIKRLSEAGYHGGDTFDSSYRGLLIKPYKKYISQVQGLRVQFSILPENFISEAEKLKGYLESTEGREKIYATEMFRHGYCVMRAADKNEMGKAFGFAYADNEFYTMDERYKNANKVSFYDVNHSTSIDNVTVEELQGWMDKYFPLETIKRKALQRGIMRYKR